MKEGTVSKMPEGKWFAFIKVQGEREDYFFHKEDYDDNWNELVEDYIDKKIIRVSFTPVEGRKGPRAANVVRVS